VFIYFDKFVKYVFKYMFQIYHYLVLNFKNIAKFLQVLINTIFIKGTDILALPIDFWYWVCSASHEFLSACRFHSSRVIKPTTPWSRISAAAWSCFPRQLSFIWPLHLRCCVRTRNRFSQNFSFSAYIKNCYETTWFKN
jgi:hypothetical protein